MKTFLLFISLFFACPAFAVGPVLGAAYNVAVTQRGTDERDPVSKYCKDFTLSAAQAKSFINKAAIVTQRELHDYYDILPCFVRGTATFHGYPANWEIRAGGTGHITLLSGEYLPIVDEAERNEPEEQQ